MSKTAGLVYNRPIVSTNVMSMPLLTLRQVTLSHGGDPLFANANLVIESGEKVCLIGRNGAGKSSLFQLIEDKLKASEGVIERAPNLAITKLEQKVPDDIRGQVSDIIRLGIAEHLQDDWQTTHQVEQLTAQLALDANASFAELSGGLKRRVLLAKALASDPDILLLDEPTNHLDIEAITWLETFLTNYKKTLIFITHDRSLLQKVATHIVEIDNGQLISQRCNYDRFLKTKEERLNAEAIANKNFDKKLAQEEVWIRQGIKARRTRNEGRVRALKKMREEHRARRTRAGNVSLVASDAEQSGKLVCKINHISFSYPNTSTPMIKDFSSVITRGDKIGFLGPNGSGKSTLLKLILGELTPNTGTLEHGTKLEIAYFDQLREQLDENLSVAENIGQGQQSVTIGGKQKHIMSYCQDFLFTPERARAPITALSGGERHRVLLAKLFTQPCNVLVLDEPTNDLDLETLELLEEFLTSFSATLLLVSHDRTFLNNVVTSLYVMEGDGLVGEYVGGYDDWCRQRKAPLISTDKATESPAAKPEKAKSSLTQDERRELNKLPRECEKLETKIAACEAKFGAANYYDTHSPDQIKRAQEELSVLNQKLEVAFARWEALEAKS